MVKNYKNSSIFEKNFIGNSLQYVTNNLHFVQLLIILHQMQKEEHIIAMVIKSCIHRKRCLKETLTIQ